MLYNITYHICSEYGDSKTLKGKVSFHYTPNDYGNGYYMAVSSDMFTYGYDIRYDKDFSKDHIISYIVRFYENEYNGKNGAWKLVGIGIHEAEEV